MALDLSGMPLDNLLLSRLEAPIGDIRQSALNEAAFDSQTIGVWKLMNGQSCAGTEYEALTGNSNVPNATSEGTFLRQAKAGRALGSYEADALQGHHHNVYGIANQGVNGGNADMVRAGGQNFGARAQEAVSDGVNGTPRIANETRSKNLAVNFFIKVAHA